MYKVFDKGIKNPSYILKIFDKIRYFLSIFVEKKMYYLSYFYFILFTSCLLYVRVKNPLQNCNNFLTTSPAIRGQ